MTARIGRTAIATRRLWVAVIAALAILDADGRSPLRAAPDASEPALRLSSASRRASEPACRERAQEYASRMANPRTTALNPFQVEMRDARGRRLRLTDFKGRIVLVDLFASWCAECRVSFPVLDALSREYRARDVEIVAVNLDQRQKDAAAFLAVRPHEMLVLFDPRARLLEAFGAPGIPSSYVIDRQGTVRYQHHGYTAATEAQYRQQIDVLLAEPEP
jgi:thiol-disulfide isomerase/thioredoxin